MADAPTMNDVKSKVKGLDQPGKLLLFGGLAALVGTLFPWWTSDFHGQAAEAMRGFIPGGSSILGVDSTQGKLALLGSGAALGTLAHAMFGMVPEARQALYRKIQLGGAGAACLGAIWFWLSTNSGSNEAMSYGHGIGMWITLIGGAVATFGAFQRFKSA